jgi:phospholipid-binding lipoprotein MlaA
VTRAALGLAALLGLACASPATQADLGELDHDPWQRGNRRVFAFNESVDAWVLAPVARGWTAITPETARVHLGQFFQNLAFPRQFVNSLLQAEPYQAGVEFWRFAINTTVGIAGFFDPASEIGLVRREEDFGQTLGVWGVGSGRYVMLPLLGPSTLRDTAGLPFDMVLNGAILIPGAGVVRAVNTRALLAEDIEGARESALDFYAFVRNAYLQLRRAQVSNESEAPPVQDDDLYEVPPDEP